MSAHPPRAAHHAAPIARRPKGRSERVQRQVFDAALTILARDGRVGLTMEAIANEAGVHKTTLYRRWGSVEPLVREACADYDDTAMQAPDTGSFRGGRARAGPSVRALPGAAHLAGHRAHGRVGRAARRRAAHLGRRVLAHAQRAVRRRGGARRGAR
jgi:AcrR family transcriptional regulator